MDEEQKQTAQKIRQRRRLYRLQKFIGRNLKKVALFLGMQAAVSLAPDNSAKAQENTATSPVINQKEWLAEAQPSDIQDYWEALDNFIHSRQRSFACDVSQELQSKIEQVRAGIKAGRKTATLRKLFGKGINTRYYCAISALRIIDALSKNKGYFEYDFLMKCIKNPHACFSVIEGLTQAYGDKCYTKDIKKSVHDELQRNPHSVFVAVLRSNGNNSSSGRHLMIITPEFAADTLVSKSETGGCTVYGLNSEVIEDMDAHLSGKRNTGNLFNITEIGRDHLIDLFYQGKLDISADKSKTAEASPVQMTSPQTITRANRREL